MANIMSKLIIFTFPDDSNSQLLGEYNSFILTWYTNIFFN